MNPEWVTADALKCGSLCAAFETALYIDAAASSRQTWLGGSSCPGHSRDGL